MAQKVQLNSLEMEPLQGTVPSSASAFLTLRDAPESTLFLFGSSNARICRHDPKHPLDF